MAAAARGYLLLYTLAQLAGTAIVLCLAFGSLGRGPAAVYEACGAPVKLMQTLIERTLDAGDVDPAAAAVVKAFNHRQDVCTSSDDTTASSSSDVQVQVQIPKNEFDNMEYIRRCKATFAQLTRKHDVETVLTKYDEFLSRPKERVLADPAYFYSGSV